MVILPGITWYWSSSISRLSRWRYAFPAEWVWYFYFGIGVAEIFGVSALLFGAQSEKILVAVSKDQPRPLTWTRGLVWASVFALIGAVPWLAEGLFLPRYTDQTTA